MAIHIGGNFGEVQKKTSGKVRMNFGKYQGISKKFTREYQGSSGESLGEDQKEPRKTSEKFYRELRRCSEELRSSLAVKFRRKLWRCLRCNFREVQSEYRRNTAGNIGKVQKATSESFRKELRRSSGNFREDQGSSEKFREPRRSSESLTEVQGNLK